MIITNIYYLLLSIKRSFKSPSVSVFNYRFLQDTPRCATSTCELFFFIPEYLASDNLTNCLGDPSLNHEILNRTSICV